MKSIKMKLVILYIMLVFIVMLVIGTVMLFSIKTSETKKSEEELSRAATNINLEYVQTGKTFEEIQEELRNPRSINISHIIVEILLTSGKTVMPVNTSNDSNSVNKVIIAAIGDLESKGHFKYGQKYIDEQGIKKVWNEYAIKVKVQDKDLEYIIYTRTNADSMLERLGEMANIILIASIFAFMIAAIIGFLFAGTLTNPIARLTKKAKELAKSNAVEQKNIKELETYSVETKTEVIPKDEIGQLTESFNDMSKQLSYTISNISSEKNKMEILLHNMTDGVLAYDISGVLIHANYLCQDLLEFNDIESIPFEEMTKKLGIDIGELDLLQMDTLKESTVEISDKFISAILTTYANKYGYVEGIIIVLQDVTKFKKLDNMRKEFVANVSHEIRTPLTTIKSYTETLIDGAIDNREMAMNFLKVIDAEADRMTLLVKDLLELSRFDNQQLKLELKEVNIVSLIEECLLQNKLASEKKEQKLYFECKDDIVLYVDKGRINQVFSNVIGNAIKYSLEEATVKITTENTKNYFLVTIKDTGIGIPKEDLKSIFERFYRVDKARSRAMGGTGLGLAIAKEIMKAHSGKISAESEQGVGTTITIAFNKDFKEVT